MIMQKKTKQNPLRGSKKHIRNLILRPDYLQTMNRLLSGSRARISKSDISCPNRDNPLQEKFLRTFCKEFLSQDFNFEEFKNWWVLGKNPTWDLISTCRINDRKGLIIVEAKANEKELKDPRKKPPPKDKIIRLKNYKTISRRIVEARRAIARQIEPRISIKIESHYQLSNRIAMGWKLADCSLPVILLYLGFIGDTSLETYFKNDDHWQRTMGAYMHKILPLDFPGERISGKGNANLIMLIRSLSIIEESPPASKKHWVRKMQKIK